MHIKINIDSVLSQKCNKAEHNFPSMKQSFCNVFKSNKRKEKDESIDGSASITSFKDRSLPPLPSQIVCSYSCDGNADIKSISDIVNSTSENKVSINISAHLNDGKDDDSDTEFGERSDHCVMDKYKTFDFATNIEKVKDYGWYWGPLSSEGAEKLLQNEPDGSFIVRDSSDDRYIFSLTFKLNACIRHVRIEHGQGNFSFGNYTKFKSHTIVEFIENAVQHSKSGRYLFFLHRRPILGPMRVQLLYPVSRFKNVQSLQHMCRFVILKTVRRDLVASLPLPKPLIEYLNCKDYYTELNF